MRVASVALLMLVLSMPLAVAEAPRVVEWEYDVGLGLAALCPTGPGMAGIRGGGVCFDVSPGETSVKIEVEDATFAEVPALFSVQPHGDGGVFCGETTVTVPADTTYLRIWVGRTIDTREWDEAVLCDAPVGTQGTVRATFP